MYITTPYFIPDISIINAIKQSALGGVDVRLMIPELGDSVIVDYATKSYVEELLGANVKVYYYKKGFVHSKTIVADGFVSVVGTANMDERSLDLNFEVSAVIYDEKTAQKMEEDFFTDLKQSRQITIKEYENLSFPTKLAYKGAKLLSAFL